ncbi:IS200/IS605 family element RNA-guided endonuclease TnpB [Trichococcus pasteurii]|uniref:Transposase probable is891/is1136/is1341 n=1 Tax=Trichococcus pasteurii TaxID=43064 RepID=A0A1W1IGZ1_9LACT|nr:IS200/IS605 family element RNA-guided endonuclease TnpB [Trichococcus pasteurii]SFE89680.1 putative transposase [Trichococcus pasteurii]SLM52298.1 transposase probable is891/is1136/is1341 [Trichococcus pasteurii]SSB93179.1 transposase probable is891/is1136/is1341 [Trichococcus pasteurii]
MLKAYKFRLYPTEIQKAYFANCFGCARFVYNRMLNDKIEHYKETNQMLKNTPAQYKNEFPFLKDVDSLALANAQQNLEKAYKNFFRDKSVGFPKFKSKHKSNDSYTTNNQGGNIRIEDNKIKLPKIGFVKIRQHRDFDGLIKSCTISMTKTGKYFISILVEQEVPEWVPAEHKIGIDLGISDFAVTTNDADESVKHANPKCLYRSEQKVKKAQRALSRKQKGSKNREKARLVLAKKHEKIVNQRKDFLHKLSDQITDENQVIVIETLRSSNMMKNHKLAKAIGDVSWSEFCRQLAYKAEWKGGTLIKADRFYPSSQICSACGQRDGKKALHIRAWTCPECGTTHDRDINASRNLLVLAK